LEATIQKVENGYSVFVPNYVDGEGNEYGASFVFEEDEDDEFGDVEVLGKVLWCLIECFGLYGSRHDRKRIRVNVEPGDKYEDNKKVN